MSSQLKPIKLYGHQGPNPPKVTIVLKELGIPFEMADTQMADVKKPEYLAVNPNGRLPAIHDPNTNITLWESGAILEYLIERYDTEHRLSFKAGTAEYYHAKQWLFFQTTGQGPYYGQVVYFKKYHHEQVPSTVERFTKEVNRVTGVLEGHLKAQKDAAGAGGDGPWLVGNKMSYADIAFVPWQRIMAMFCSKEEYNEDDYPLVKEWIAKMTSRESLREALQIK